ncbi:hypothetical protein [Bacillus sp. T3]|uniref:hypothetical protein n=1 Tax=Bacillus sp. T3 TaxID=467262 RepID=UPI0029811C4E|nr:hypothetical protein [Bacillus sp. T3]
MKKAIKNSIVKVILFILKVGLVLGAGMYRTALSAEKAQFQAKIPGKDNFPIVLDLAKQGWPKKLIQPGLVQISNGHGPMGIQNISNEDLYVQVSLKNFPGEVELDIPEMEYDKETNALIQPLKPEQFFKVDLAVEIPKEYRNKLVGFSGAIQFINQKDQSLLSSIPIHIVNSDYGDPYKKLNIKPQPSFGQWDGSSKNKPAENLKKNKEGKDDDGKQKNDEQTKEENCH